MPNVFKSWCKDDDAGIVLGWVLRFLCILIMDQKFKFVCKEFQNKIYLPSELYEEIEASVYSIF